jgi:hypothetical protein
MTGGLIGTPYAQIALTNNATIQGWGTIGGTDSLLNTSVDNYVSLTNNGTINANSSGKTLLITGGAGTSFSNDGIVKVANNSTLDVGLNYLQTAGQTTVESGGTLTTSDVELEGGTVQVESGGALGTLDPASIDIFSSGILEGTGDILGNITNDGTLIIGDSATAPGVLSESGNYIQDSGGTMDWSIESDSLFSTFDVTGDISLGGTLDINVLPGFGSSAPEYFDIINFTGSDLLGSEFATIDFTGTNAADWTVLYTANSVELELITPIALPPSGVPDTGSTLLLFGVGLVGLVLVASLKRHTV